MKSSVCDELFFHWRRGWSTLCLGPPGLALRPFRWPCPSRLMDFASEAVAGKAQVFFKFASVSWNGQRRVGPTPPKWKEEFYEKVPKIFLLLFSLLENACFVIHGSTNQMPNEIA